jgi:hypothetical protein
MLSPALTIRTRRTIDINLLPAVSNWDELFFDVLNGWRTEGGGLNVRVKSSEDGGLDVRVKSGLNLGPSR